MKHSNFFLVFLVLLLLIPPSSAENKNLMLPSAPCSCIVEEKREEKCVKDKVELKKIESDFKSQSAECDPHAGCSIGHAVIYKLCK